MGRSDYLPSDATAWIVKRHFSKALELRGCPLAIEKWNDIGVIGDWLEDQDDELCEELRGVFYGQIVAFEFVQDIRGFFLVSEVKLRSGEHVKWEDRLDRLGSEAAVYLDANRRITTQPPPGPEVWPGMR